MRSPEFDLQELARPALEVPRPPAAEIRRRGTARRHRRVAATLAAVTASAVLLGGIAWGATSLGRQPDPVPTATGTPSSSIPRTEPPVAGSPAPAAAPQPTWRNFPSQKELGLPVSGRPFPETDETGWTDQAKASACYVDGAGLGARTVLSRNIGAGGEEAGETLVVLGFDSEAAATQARLRIAEWYRTCGARLLAKGNVMGQSEAATRIKFSASVPPGAVAEFHTVVWKPQGVQWGNFENASVVQVGNRLSWQFFPIFDAAGNECTATGPDDAPACEVALQATVIAQKLGG